MCDRVRGAASARVEHEPRHERRFANARWPDDRHDACLAAETRVEHLLEPAQLGHTADEALENRARWFGRGIGHRERARGVVWLGYHRASRRGDERVEAVAVLGSGRDADRHRRNVGG